MDSKQTAMIYNISDFEPQIVDKIYLDELGVNTIAPITLHRLEVGSRTFAENYHQRKLFSDLSVLESDQTISSLEVHNYTGCCPTNTFELNPVTGSCQVKCLYCLVTDGDHTKPTVVFRNYCDILAKHLEAHVNTPVFYYYSPKTEAFQGATLITGIAHDIIRQFIQHFKEYPQSCVRLFIASKAGIMELKHQHKGDSIIDLLSELHDRVQFNTSIGIMPQEIQQLIEPYAASFEDRLDAVRLCQEQHINARSVLTQPILPTFLNDVAIEEYFAKMKKYNICNYKPEFLTVCPENLAAIAQIVGHFNKNHERELYEMYLSTDNLDHKKQRDRIAPCRGRSREMILRMRDIALLHGISMSICYWVRTELDLSEIDVPLINKNGFRCLGYDTRLLKPHS